MSKNIEMNQTGILQEWSLAFDRIILSQFFDEYLEKCMRKMISSEYYKIWEAIYGFDLLPLERISCPTIVLNGEFEPKNAFRHTKEILRRVPQAEGRII